MKPIVVTIRRRGAPAQRRVGLFHSTTDAIVETLETLGDAAIGLCISAEVLA